MTLLAKKKTTDTLDVSSVENAAADDDAAAAGAAADAAAHAAADAGAGAGADALPPVPNAEADEQSEAGDTAATPALPKVALHDDEESILLETTKHDLKEDEEPEGMSEYLNPSQLMVVLGACTLPIPDPNPTLDQLHSQSTPLSSPP